MRTSRAVALGVVTAAAVGVVIGITAARSSGQHQAAAGDGRPAVDPYSCRLGVASRIDATHTRDDAVQTVALDCPGQPLLHLPGPYGPQNALPAGLFRVPGWQVSQLLYVEGETRLWLVDEQQSCLLRTNVTGIESGGTRVTCNLRNPRTPAPPSATPVTPAPSSATPTGHPA